MNNAIKVTAALIIQQNKVLITQRRAADAMGGKWEFPGGKIELGETAVACLQRELYEELGIETEVYNLYGVSEYAYPHIKIQLLVYNVAICSGQIRLFDHQDYRWVSIQDLQQFDFCEADQPIVQKLLNNM